MTYRVSITFRAERDLADLYRDIDAASSETAWNWYQGFKKKILSLEEQPNRCPAAPEKRSLRQLLYGRKPNVYRIIYSVSKKRKQVVVLHIRHGARTDFF